MANKSFLELGAVSVHYDDYLGTAAADDADALIATRSLYQLVGLDRDRWMILSVELARTKHSDRVSIYALDKERHQVVSLADVQQLAARLGELPVVAFDLPDSVRVEDFIREAFQRISVRLVSRGVTDERLSIVRREHVAETDL